MTKRDAGSGVQAAVIGAAMAQDIRHALDRGRVDVSLV
jgi:hypothetical protein